MAKLYVTEFLDAPRILGQVIQCGAQPGVDQVPVVIGAGSLQSAAFAATTRFVRIHADSICSVAFGINPTATANSARMAANESDYFGVAPGQKVAVITNV